VTVYISGPMTGLPDHNYPLFQSVAETLRAAGYTVVSPHELNPSTRSWADCMRVDLTALLNGPEAIILLPGWEASRGAVLEHDTAKAIGLDVLPWPFQVLGGRRCEDSTR
jgi:hypothetical protein